MRAVLLCMHGRRVEAKKPGAMQNSKPTGLEEEGEGGQRQLFFIRWVTVRIDEYSLLICWRSCHGEHVAAFLS
jgi:hypothetical protein